MPLIKPKYQVLRERVTSEMVQNVLQELCTQLPVAPPDDANRRIRAMIQRRAAADRERINRAAEALGGLGGWIMMHACACCMRTCIWK